MFAAVTNNREVPLRMACPRSRGDLVLDLMRTSTAGDYLQDAVIPNHLKFKNFNLAFGDLTTGEVCYYGSEDFDHPRGVPGIGHQTGFTVSNGTAFSDWPKMKDGVQRFDEIVQSCLPEQETVDRLFRLLMDDTKHDLSLLPTNTVVGLEGEAMMSSIFVHPFERSDCRCHRFGTVSSSIILVDQDNSARFFELDWPAFYAHRAGAWPPPMDSLAEFTKCIQIRIAKRQHIADPEV